MCRYATSYLLLLLMQYVLDVNSLTPDGSQAQRLDGHFLVSMGQKFNNPLLKLIGKVVLNGEEKTTEKLCLLHPCTEWGAWPDCPVNRGFSMVTRSRKCNKPTDLCTFDGQSEFTQTESKVCQGKCPEEYMYNDTHGFCLKYVLSNMTQWDAEAVCQLDGGNLVNINTQSKSDAVHALFPSQSFEEAVWINGNRTNTASSWVFSYGASSNFSNWYHNEPSNGTSELCKVEQFNPRKWCDRGCNQQYTFVCEKN